MEPSQSKPNSASALELKIQQIENGWKSNIPPDLVTILSDVEPDQTVYVTAECIKVDMEYRWRRGTAILIEEYLKKWPDLLNDQSTVTELLESEIATRTVFAEPPQQQELDRRFPYFADSIELSEVIDAALLDRADLELDIGTARALPDDDTVAGADSNGDPPVVLLGERLGRYQIGDKIGVGGQGDVYEAVDTRISRKVALKILRVSDSKLLERFVQEPQFAARVKHNNICPIYDAGKIGGMHYIAMELVDGESIQQRIERDGPFDAKGAAKIVLEMAGALSHVHTAGIVHRDVKSGNIMLDANDRPVLMDFGLARTAAETEGFTTTQSFAGTLAFMSPEQAGGYAPDSRSDIYSLGAVLYHMLTGEVPFGLLPAEFYKHIGKSPPPSPRRMRRDLAPDLDTICRRAMAIRPEDRYATGDEMADALQRYLDGRPQVARGPAAIRLRRRMTTAAVALMLLAVAGAYLLWPDSDEPVEPAIRWLPTDGGVTSYEVDEAGDRVFVATYSLDREFPISELSLRTGKHLGEQIQLPSQCFHHGLVYLRQANDLLATNFDCDYVSRIDLDGSRTPESIRIISDEKEMGDAWRWAVGMTLTPDRTMAVVLMGGDERPEPPDGIVNEQLALIDLRQDPPKLLAEVPLGDEPWGNGRCIPPDENAIYLTTGSPIVTQTHKIYRVELTPPYRATSLEIPSGRPQDIEVSSAWNRLFIADAGNRKVWTIDRSRFGSGLPTESYEYEGHAPQDLAIHEGRGLLAVICSDSRLLLIVDAFGGHELARIERLRSHCQHVRFNHDGSRIYLASRDVRGGIGIVKVPEFRSKIAFSSDRAGGTDQIYIMNDDGTDVRPLFKRPTNAHDRLARWSPNGEYIAFFTSKPATVQVAIARFDGSGLHIYEQSFPNANTGVSWAPDGSHVAYVAKDCMHVSILDIKAGSRTDVAPQLPPPYRELSSVCWENETTVIVDALPMRDSGQMEIFRVNIITGKATRLTDMQDSGKHCEYPRVSRDGRIAVVHYGDRNGYIDGIRLLSPETSHGVEPDNLTLNGPDLQIPQLFAWFPDGKKIVFWDIDPGTKFRHLFVLDVETKTYTKLPSGGDWNDSFPDVSPPLPAQRFVSTR